MKKSKPRFKEQKKASTSNPTWIHIPNELIPAFGCYRKNYRELNADAKRLIELHCRVLKLSEEQSKQILEVIETAISEDKLVDISSFIGGNLAKKLSSHFTPSIGIYDVKALEHTGRTIEDSSDLDFNEQIRYGKELLKIDNWICCYRNKPLSKGENTGNNPKKRVVLRSLKECYFCPANINSFLDDTAFNIMQVVLKDMGISEIDNMCLDDLRRLYDKNTVETPSFYDKPSPTRAKFGDVIIALIDNIKHNIKSDLHRGPIEILSEHLFGQIFDLGEKVNKFNNMVSDKPGARARKYRILWGGIFDKIYKSIPKNGEDKPMDVALERTMELFKKNLPAGYRGSSGNISVHTLTKWRKIYIRIAPENRKDIDLECSKIINKLQ
ncbi:MAG: hypothetical protein A2X49_08715 [Lentisphaerae bacterium GWF2_52_8]|nr:MAG: hypothetical protein A2X49_08715 [Lentisphaerae bacterium GWF2_52_8]